MSVTTSQYSDVVDTAGSVRKQVRDLSPAVSVGHKTPPGAEQQSILADLLVLDFLKLGGPELTVQPVEQ